MILQLISRAAKLMKLKTFLKCGHTLMGLPPYTNPFWRLALFISYGACPTQVTQVTPGWPKSGLTGGRHGVIAALSIDIQAFFIHQNFNVAVGWAGCGLRNIGQRVLVSSLGGDLRICVFHGIAGEFAEYLSSSGSGAIFRQDVAVTLAPKMELVCLLVQRQCPTVDHNGFYLNVVGLQHLQYIPIAGLAA